MKINETYYGFKLVKSTYIKEIDSTLHEFNHVQSGCTLAYIECSDTNKAFMASFRTLPEDSTGICHIIEHSLLCGSKKYPLKEPFVNLLKGSMASFLNAMTARDFTCYPVASQNDKDFQNLMSLYLDSVFAPLSVLDSKPFLQEGWHYEMNSEDDIPSIKGVVYNEMKGAMSSVDAMLDEAMSERMYKGTGYGVNSGGNPDVIPTLTYEYYKDFYHKHYHPENALLVLYGKMDILEKLEFIDKEYLSLYKKGNNKTSIPMPKPVIETDYEKEYPISASENLENNTHMSLSFALPEITNTRDFGAFDILRSALCETNDSPLKKALLDAKLGEDVDISIDNDCILPNFQIMLKKTNTDVKDKFYNTFINACKDIIKNGIDKDILLATINNAKFKNKEMDMGAMPKGVIFALTLMSSFNYDAPLEEALQSEKNFDFYKESLNTSYFEDLMDKYFVNSKHYVLVTLVPSKDLEAKKEAEMKKKMEELKASMTKDEIEECIKQTKDLVEYQSTPDSLENLKKLPVLELSDISIDVNTIPTVQTKDNYTIYEHELNTNGIGYLSLFFDLGCLTLDEVKYVKVLAPLFKMLDTKQMDAFKLQNYIKTYLGDISFSTFLSAKDDKPVAKMVVFASALKENISYIPDVLSKLINETVFDKDKVLTILNQLKNNAREGIISNGMSIAMSESSASFRKAFKMNSTCQGKNIYDFIDKAIKNIDEFILKLKDISNKIFSKNDLIASLSGDKDTINLLKNAVSEIKLNDTRLEHVLNVDLDPIKNDALVIPSEVNYDGLALDLGKYGYDVNGSYSVLSHIVNYDYLWSQVRVLGGAYGCSMVVYNRQKVVAFGSYRDPNVGSTYDVYNNIVEYLKNFNPSDDEYKSYLIGSIGAYDQPVSNTVLINSCDRNLLLGISDDDRRKTKQEMLKTTKEDIKNLAKSFEAALKNRSIYSVGNKKSINESKLFANIKEL